MMFTAMLTDVVYKKAMVVSRWKPIQLSQTTGSDQGERSYSAPLPVPR